MGPLREGKPPARARYASLASLNEKQQTSDVVTSASARAVGGRSVACFHEQLRPAGLRLA